MNLEVGQLMRDFYDLCILVRNGQTTERQLRLFVERVKLITPKWCRLAEEELTAPFITGWHPAVDIWLDLHTSVSRIAEEFTLDNDGDFIPTMLNIGEQMPPADWPADNITLPRFFFEGPHPFGAGAPGAQLPVIVFSATPYADGSMGGYNGWVVNSNMEFYVWGRGGTAHPARSSRLLDVNLWEIRKPIDVELGAKKGEEYPGFIPIPEGRGNFENALFDIFASTEPVVHRVWHWRYVQLVFKNALDNLNFSEAWRGRGYDLLPPLMDAVEQLELLKPPVNGEDVDEQYIQEEPERFQVILDAYERYRDIVKEVELGNLAYLIEEGSLLWEKVPETLAVQLDEHLRRR